MTLPHGEEPASVSSFRRGGHVDDQPTMINVSEPRMRVDVGDSEAEVIERGEGARECDMCDIVCGREHWKRKNSVSDHSLQAHLHTHVSILIGLSTLIPW